MTTQPPTMASQATAELPKLPEPSAWKYWHKTDSLKVATVSVRIDQSLNGAVDYAEIPLFTADQMNAHYLAGYEAGRAAIEADRLRASYASAPEGYVCVPREPTRAMIKAGADAVNNDGELAIQAAWRYMVAAAPTPQALPNAAPVDAVPGEPVAVKTCAGCGCNFMGSFCLKCGGDAASVASRADMEPAPVEVSRLAEEAIAKMIDFAEDVWQAGKDGFRVDSIAACRERREVAEAAIRRVASMASTPASGQLRRDQIIDLISSVSNNSADHDVQFALRVLDAASPATDASEVPAGMALVPRTATEAIELAGEKALVAEFGRASRETWADVCGRVYAAMVAIAAAEVPAARQESGEAAIGFSPMWFAPIDGTPVLLYMPTTGDKFAIGQFHSEGPDTIRGTWGDDEGNFFVHEPTGWMGLHVLERLAAAQAAPVAAEAIGEIVGTEKRGFALMTVVRWEPGFNRTKVGTLLYAHSTASTSTAAPAGEVALPTAYDYAAKRQMAVTSEWCRGWDDARAAAAQWGLRLKEAE